MERLLLLLCVSMPSFMINLDANIVAVSLPSISRSLHADFATVEWVMSAYTLAFAALVLPAGALADRFGRKRMLVTGLAVFTLASLACGVAPGAGALIAARAVQGCGAATQLSAALAILSHQFRGVERARAFAFWGSVIGIGITMGPLAGGALTQTLGWEWAFYINVPIGAALAVLVLRTVRESTDAQTARLDLAGAATFSAALFLLTYALISGNHMGWADPRVAASLGASAVLLAGFAAIELRSPRPMLELQLLLQPTFLGANVAGLAYAASLLTMLTYLPLFLQTGLGRSPVAAGLLMLPIAAPLFLVPRIVSQHLAHRVSGRGLVVLGLALVAVGMAAVAAASPRLDYPALAPGLLLAGCGAGILNGETAKVGVSAIPPERAGMASGMSGAVRFTGIVLGFAGLGAVLTARISSALAASTPIAPADVAGLAQSLAAGRMRPENAALAKQLLSAFTAGYQTVFAAAAVIAAAAALACWFLIDPGDTAPIDQSGQSVPVVLD